ncbi:MAG: polyprenol monophosphomannose synthase [Tepidisphaeraceae bacterium]
MDTPEISLVIPALNEAANLTPLAERIAAALAGRAYELLIVDDNSRDDTPAVCAKLAERFPLKLIVRTTPKDGLSGAVLHGFDFARGRTIVVMDADLQHPPEAIPSLVAALDDGADFVIGSRYVAGGEIEGEWPWYRRINSRVATWLARPFAGRVADPMSGFFAMRRTSFEHAQRLTPLGYKIALELLCKARCKSVREVPIHFARRTAGESKLSLKEQFRYLEHLSRLYDFSYPRLSPILKFGTIILFSWLIALANFAALRAADWRVWPAVVFTYGWVILTTAVFHGRYVRTQREFLARPRPWRDFCVASLIEWSACAVTAAYLVKRATSLSAIEVLAISFLAALAARYVLRKELLLDLRGLHHEVRKDEMTR